MKPFPWQMKQWRSKRYLCGHPSCAAFGRHSSAFQYCLCLFFSFTLCFSNSKVFLQVEKLHVCFPVAPPACCSGFHGYSVCGCRGDGGSRRCSRSPDGCGRGQSLERERRAGEAHWNRPPERRNALFVMCKKFNWKLSGFFFWSELCASRLILQEQKSSDCRETGGM